MNKRILSSILCGGVFACIALLFVSCNNFMNAGKIKTEIEEAIEIANSSAITYYVTAPKDSGSVNPVYVNLKKKESTLIMFEPADEWKFICWEAIDRDSGEVINDVVKFEDPTKLETKATIQTPRENLAIHAKCLQLPAVVSVSPSNGVPQMANTPIEITFNMPMEAEETTKDNSIFNYDNIQITYNDMDLRDYFELPEFDSTKTVLKLVPTARAFQRFIKARTNTNLSVTISLTNKLCVSVEDTELPLVQNEKSSFRIVFNTEIDNEPPSKEEFFISKDRPSVFNEDNSFKQLSNLSDENDIIRNRTLGIVYIYGKYSDADSGIKTVTIKERRINDIDAQPVTDVLYTTKYTKDSVNDDVVFIQNGNEIEFIIKYQLSSDIGQVLLTTIVSDACDNHSAKQEVAVIHNNADCFKNFKVNNIKKGVLKCQQVSSQSNYNNTQDYQEKIKTLRILKETAHEQIYGTIKADWNNIVIKCLYNGNEDVFTDSSDGSERLLTLDVDDDKIGGLPFTIIITDTDTHIEKRIDLIIPSAPQVIVQSKDDSNATVSFKPSDPITLKGFFPLQLKSDNSLELVTGDSNSNYSCWIFDSVPFETYIQMYSGFHIPNGSNSYYFFVVSTFDDQAFLASDITSICKYSTLVKETVPKVILPDNPVSISKGAVDNQTNITVTIDSHSWENEKYDFIYMCLYNGSIQKTSPVYFENGQIQQSMVVESKDLISPNLKIKVFGIKNGNLSEGADGTVPVFTSQYDNIPPEISKNSGRQSYYDYKIQVNEYGSEADYLILITADGERIKLADRTEGSDFNNIRKDTWILNDYSSNGLMTFEVKDTANNVKLYNIPFPGYDYKYTVTKIKKAAGTTNQWHFYTEQECENINNHSSYFNIYTWDPTEKEWIGSSGSREVFHFYHDSDENCIIYGDRNVLIFQDNTFIKIIPEDGKHPQTYAAPVYFYTATVPHGLDENKYIINNTQDSVFIASDTPAFIRTVGTTRSYYECFDWTAEEWENNHFEAGEECFEYSSTNRFQKKYTIPLQKIRDKGCKCYVVLANCVDGTYIKSDVFEL